MHRNPAALADNGGPWRGLDDVEIATCGWVAWFNEHRLQGELNHLTPAEVEDAYYRDRSQSTAAWETNPPSTPKRKTQAGSVGPVGNEQAVVQASCVRGKELTEGA